MIEELAADIKKGPWTQGFARNLAKKWDLRSRAFRSRQIDRDIAWMAALYFHAIADAARDVRWRDYAGSIKDEINRALKERDLRMEDRGGQQENSQGDAGW